MIQHHAASTDHYDFRCEIDGVLNPKDKRMARRTEDHPLEFQTFEGVIPRGKVRCGWRHRVGPHDRINRRSEAHAVLDEARAAKKLSGTALTAMSLVAIAGYSQGGGGAAADAELQRAMCRTSMFVAA
ncbi:DNA polymerase ligase N-terminal domain-containing protein [Nocardia sp. NPDC004604]|uniref:DNA polymerase ligase N-terminal domain-containing protein n=1 Tax=Nocardia sp. NPDC004604 TaxID=3157013 RepID=UPI0033AD50F0